MAGACCESGRDNQQCNQTSHGTVREELSAGVRRKIERSMEHPEDDHCSHESGGNGYCGDCQLVTHCFNGAPRPVTRQTSVSELGRQCDLIEIGTRDRGIASKRCLRSVLRLTPLSSPSATKSSGSSVPSCSNLLIVFSTSWKSRAGHVTVERARLDLYLTATCNRDRGDAELAIWKSTSLGAFRYSDRAPITSARSRRPTRGNRSCDRGPIRSPARSSVSVLAPLPREYLVFGDIEGKLDVLRVECTKCSRRGV
jgi:hypothetical protein